VVLRANRDLIFKGGGCEQAASDSQVKPLELTITVEPSAESKGWRMCLDANIVAPLTIR